jgi:hypothetical protein
MKNKVKKGFDRATVASVKKEMAKPRMAKSVREEEANRAAGRIMPGKARKGQAAVASEEWIRKLEDGRRVKFIYQELPEDGAFITAQLEGNEAVYIWSY